MTKRSLFLVRLSLFVAFTAFIQIAGLPQPVTGPLINAILLIAASLMGSVSAILIGCLTPLAALVRGQLPPILAVMVPFIAAANAILILLFNGIRKTSRLPKRNKISLRDGLALLAASTGKFLFLALSVKLILPVFIGKSVPEKIAVAMMAPQLATALVGGVIALFFLRVIEKAGVWRE